MFDLDESGRALLGFTPPDMNDLTKAVKNGNKATVEYLLNVARLDVNGIDDDYHTSLQIAAEYGHCSIVELLLDKGAEIDRGYVELDGEHTPLLYAIKYHP